MSKGVGVLSAAIVVLMCLAAAGGIWGMIYYTYPSMDAHTTTVSISRTTTVSLPQTTTLTPQTTTLMPQTTTTLTQVTVTQGGAIVTTTMTQGPSTETVTESGGTATVTQGSTETIVSTTTVVASSTTSTYSWTGWNGTGRPPLYPFTLEIFDYCPGFLNCVWSGQLSEVGPLNLYNIDYNMSVTVQPFYEGGCAPTGPCPVTEYWNINPAGSGSGNYIQTIAYYDGMVAANISNANTNGASLDGTVCLAYCS